MKMLLLTFFLILITNLSIGQWTKNYFLDEFGDTTKQAYIAQRCTGTFSNSATLNSSLTADVFVYKTYGYDDPSLYQLWLSFNLFEYNSQPVNKEQFGELTIKTSNNERSHIKIWHGLRFSLSRPIVGKAKRSFEDDDGLAILNKFLNDTTPIKCYIQLEDGSTYNFNVDPNGFDAALRILM